MSNLRNKKRSWNTEEDQQLIELVQIHGPQQWNSIAVQLDNRTGKQCRERWHNQLDPSLKRLGWSNAEEWILFILQRRSANKWAEFVNYLYGRSDNAIKNYWNTALNHRITKFDAAIDNYFMQLRDNAYQNGDQKTIQALQNEEYRRHVEQDLLDQYVEEARNRYLKYLHDKIESLKENIELNSQTIEYLSLLINKTIASITEPKEHSVFESNFSSYNDMNQSGLKDSDNTSQVQSAIDERIVCQPKAIMPHDLVAKLPCDASKMIQLNQKRKVKGLRKRHAQIEKAIRACNSSFSISSSQTKRKIKSEKLRLESDIKSFNMDQSLSGKFLTEASRSRFNGIPQECLQYADMSASNK